MINNIKSILINDRYIIYENGVIYDTYGYDDFGNIPDIPFWVFEIRNKIFDDERIGKNESI